MKSVKTRKSMSKSVKKVNKRKKFFTTKARTQKSVTVNVDSVVKSVNDKESQYKLSLNKLLVSFRPTLVEPLVVCNLQKAFRYEEKLNYKLNGKCYAYDTPIVEEYLLKRLKNNKVVSISKIIAPKQIDSNCWFNSMFMMFFISDRGRIFFHYMRELMIKGETLGTIIEPQLRNVFALLNFIAECCLTGNELAHRLNTNKIIEKIYKLTKEKNIVSYNIGEAGNPIYYYRSLIQYLGRNELKVAIVNPYTWKKDLKKIDPPHIVIIQFHFNNKVKKPLQFSIGEYVYELDSASVIDNSRQHFCSTITCNGVQFAFDGYSKSRLIPFEWKSKINENINWGFKDYIYEFDDDTLWNFMEGYSCLCYYRII